MCGLSRHLPPPLRYKPWLLYTPLPTQEASAVCAAVGMPSEDGYHITFDCPHHHQQRRELIGNARTWEDLDTPIWRKEEEWDAVEAFFAYLYRPLAGR
ncbi:hypothetical protein EV426DRAFT_700455 [Tirmania nivea]|nr:hypothetical protein EV426DRAFT_700455 [Tirmania nivea]